MKAIVLALSLLPLIGLSLILYFFDNKSKLGIITSVSVVLMDFFSMLIYQSNLVDSPILVVVLLIVNRVMMIAMGANYFIYGYMLLYIMYSLAFVYQIARNKFPYEGDVVLQAAGVTSFVKQLQETGKTTRGMTADQKSEHYRRLVSNP